MFLDSHVTILVHPPNVPHVLMFATEARIDYSTYTHCNTACFIVWVLNSACH
jgi:hypothetical protein